jgi:hypothetical protein
VERGGCRIIRDIDVEVERLFSKSSPVTLPGKDGMSWSNFKIR